MYSSNINASDPLFLWIGEFVNKICTISNHAYFLIAELIPSTNGPLLDVKSSRYPLSVWATRPPRVSRGPPRAAGREDPCFLRATSYVLATPLLCITPPWWSCPRLPPIWSGRVQSTAGRRDELGTTWDHLGNTRTNKVCPPTGIKCPGGLRDRQCQQWLSVNQSQCLKAAFVKPQKPFQEINLNLIVVADKLYHVNVICQFFGWIYLHLSISNETGWFDVLFSQENSFNTCYSFQRLWSCRTACRGRCLSPPWIYKWTLIGAHDI